MQAERYDERHLQKALEAARTLSVLVQRNTQENQQLAQLRDWLLPLLMNGQVTVA